MSRKGDSGIFPNEEVTKTETEHSNVEATAESPNVFKTKASIKNPSQDKVKIIIEKQDNYEGQFDVTVGVNGYVYQIKRGVPVEVPHSVIEVLKNAVMSKMVKDDHGNDVLVDMPRFLWRQVA